MINQTAILIFANSAKKEAERKSFLSQEIFSELNAKTLKTVQKSGITYFHFSEENQFGKSFGERFTNAIETIFKKGFQHIITVGNDTPHLKTKHLIYTEKKLKSNDLVLGPSKDGGFYLMGISKKQFDRERFLNLPWQTNHLQSYIAKIATRKELKIFYLEILNDLDAKQDIFKIIHSFKSVSIVFLKLLHVFIITDKKIQNQYKLYTLEKSFTKNFNKGSPVNF